MKIKQLARNIAHNEVLLGKVIRQLELAGKTKDYCDFDSKGEPRDVSYLAMVRFGIDGLTLQQIRDVL